MEFVDNTGHIFSLPSYDELPIGYEYEENPYIFWIDATNTSKLSVNNYYSKPIYILYRCDDNFDVEKLTDENNPLLSFDIYIKESNVFKLISPKKFQECISKEDFSLNDYVNLNMLEKTSEDGHIDYVEKYSFIKEKLNNDDIYAIKTSESLNESTIINYLMIPIYPIAMASEPGTWITNIMIHIKDNESNRDEWCDISVGGEFISEYEELVINGKNMGITLPKDILRSIYNESLYNDEYNEALYNKKIKEYLFNYMNIKGNTGNFKSAVDSLKWFGYGDKLTISKLLRTDNEVKEQYILDYFNLSNDILESFKTFVSKAYVSIMLMINKELDECEKFDKDSDNFYGEAKPKTLSLLDYYEKIQIGNNDMPIEDDKEKYFYWKPYFNFSFNELGIKLMCLAHYYKKYFLPIHLNIHNASLGYRVFTNDVKLTNVAGSVISYPSIMLNNKNDVEFTGSGVHYFTKQIHLVDEWFNEYSIFTDPEYQNSEIHHIYKIDDTCVNIPIRFKNPGYYNCVLLLQKASDNKTIYETHFAFCQDEDSNEYKNFIIYPKKFNTIIDGEKRKSKHFDYWINKDFIIKLLVNNTWYEYNFTLKIHKPQVDFGTLKYRYFINDHNFVMNKFENNDLANIHNLIMYDDNDRDREGNSKIVDTDISDTNIYEELNNVDISMTGYVGRYFQHNHEEKDINTFSIDYLSEESLNEDEYVYIINCDNINNINLILDNDGDDVYKYTYKIKSFSIDDVTDNTYTAIIYPERLGEIQLIKTDLLNINSIIYNKLHLNSNISFVESFNTSFEDHLYQYFKQNYNLISPFRQLSYVGTIDDKKVVSFNAYMHNKQIVNVNDIDYDVNMYDIIQYHLDHNLMYVDKDMINDKYYKYILYNDHIIYICDEMIGKTIEFKTDILENYPNYLIYKEGEQKYVISINEDGSATIIENSNDSETVTLYYDVESNAYYNSDAYYYIYDRLHNNIDLINDRYNTIVNLPDNLKYKNSVHMFGLYTTDEDKKNVLAFRNDIDMWISGLHFTHKRTSDLEDNNQLKIYINGNLTENIDSRYPDVYGLYWNDVDPKPIIDMLSNNNDYAIYIKDNRFLGNQDESLNLYDYDTSEFRYVFNTEFTTVCYGYYESLDDFYINKPTKYEYEPGYEKIEIEFDNDKFYFNDLAVKDITDTSKYYKNELSYNIIFLNSDGSEMEEISLNNIEDKTYTSIKVEFKYHVPYIVRNKFFTLPDYISEVSPITDMLIYDSDGKHLFKFTKDGEEHIIELIYLGKKYQYIDNQYGNIISNQNPAAYWYNVDDGKIETLSLYLNELERFSYDEKIVDLDTFENNMNLYLYKHFMYNKFADDANEALYNYQNYLTKELTGISGDYEMYILSNYQYKDKIRLCMEAIDEDNNMELYSVNSSLDVIDSVKINLSGSEKSVKIYVQIAHEDNEEMNNIYIIPKLDKIINIEKRLEYVPEEYSTDVITVKINDKEYSFGDNQNEKTVELYNKFFKLKYSMYDTYIHDNTIKSNLLYRVYDNIKKLNLNMYLNYDFYLMHDDKYWYGLYISQETCNFVRNLHDLSIPDNKKKIQIKTSGETYVFNYEKSSNEYLINRFEYISSHGVNQFKNDDIIACYIYNNDRLPFASRINSKWNIKPMSLGMSTSKSFESNGEMTILSLPFNNNTYEKGYYNVDIRYSIDRDIQHQFKHNTKIRVS